MTKGMIICVSEMSSSMMAKKVTDYFKEQGKDIEIDAMISSMGDDEIRTGDEDIFLISPQTKMYLETFQNTGKEVGKPVVASRLMLTFQFQWVLKNWPNWLRQIFNSSNST